MSARSIAICSAATNLTDGEGNGLAGVLESAGLGESESAIVSSLASGSNGVSQLLGEVDIADGAKTFRVVSMLGAGAFGGVFAATELESGCEVALKIPRTGLGESAMVAVEWELRAHEALADLPGVLPLREVVSIGETQVLVTERCQLSLEAYARGRDDGRLSPDEAIQIVSNIAETLADVHRRGFVHRDIKPHNILLSSDGAWVIGDLGLCVLGRERGVAALAAGTAEYQAPESFEARPIDLRGPETTPADYAQDVYSLGCLLFRLVEGHPPLERQYDVHGLTPEEDFLRRLRAEHYLAMRYMPDATRAVVRACLSHNTLSRPVMDQIAELLAESRPVLERALERMRLRQFQPRLPKHHVSRSELLDEVHHMLVNQQQVGLNQIAAIGDGGHGKTMLAIAVAQHIQQHAWDDVGFPGGIYFANVGLQSAAEAFASLVKHSSIEQFRLEVEQIADLVKRKLESAPPSLLIVDNVHNEKQWAGMQHLIPEGNVAVLVTTRERQLHDLACIPVDKLKYEEAIDVLKSFRPDAAHADNEGATRKAYDELEGMAFAIASLGALMQLDSEMTWADAESLVAEAPLHELSATSAEGGEALDHPAPEARSTLASLHAILDALRYRLSDAQRSALDIAARLPQDAVVVPWLQAICAGEGGAAAAADDGQRVGAEDPVGSLLSLGLLTVRVTEDADTPESVQICSLHRLHTRRSNDLLAEDPERLEKIDSAIHAHVASRLDTVIEYPLRPAAHFDHTLRWELGPLAANCDTLWRRDDTARALEVAAMLGFALVELWRPVDAEKCLPESQLRQIADAGTVGTPLVARVLAWRGVWESRNRNSGHAAHFTELSLRHHRTRNRTKSADYAIDLGIASMCVFDADLTRLREAEQMARDSIDLYREARPNDPLIPVYAIDILAGKQRDAGDQARVAFETALAERKYAQAESTIGEGLGIAEQLGQNGVVLKAKLLYRLGTVLTRVEGREAHARDALKEALRLYNDLYPNAPDHRDVLNTRLALRTLSRAITARRKAGTNSPASS